MAPVDPPAVTPRPPAVAPVPPAPFFSARDKWAGGVAAAITFVAYLFSLQPSVGLEDSGEFLAAAYNLGVPHPPGYPIWTILAWLWCHLLPVGNIAWRVNLMSAGFGALAVGLAALLISKTGHVMGARVGFLHQLPQRVVDRLVLGSAVAGSLLLAFAPVMWSQSVITEVYALNAFFLFAVLVLLYRWSFETERCGRLYAAAFIWGVSLTNHQTLVLLTIAFPAFIWMADRKFGRDVLVPILGVIVVVVLKMISTSDSMFYHGPFTGAVVAVVGMGAAAWLILLVRSGGGRMPWVAGVLLTAAAVVMPLRQNLTTSPDLPPVSPVVAMLTILAWLTWLVWGGWWLYMIFKESRHWRMLAGLGLGVAVVVVAVVSRDQSGPVSGILIAVAGVALVAAAGIGLTWLQSKAELVRVRVRTILVYLSVALGLLLYGYIHLSSATNPPMNWGYARTPQGFMHSFTRGQYQKTRTERAPLEQDATGQKLWGVYWSRTLVKCWGQINLFFDDLREQYTLPLALLALPGLFFFWKLDKADQDWLRFLMLAFLFLGLGFLFLSNPEFDKQKQFTDRVFFLPCHCLFALWVGYGLILGLGYLLVQQPGWQRAVSPVAAALLILPAISAKLHWANNEQGGHDFGYQFGYRMFKPEGGYLEMEHGAVLYGGTDPGRFVPTYMIFVESLAPARGKTRMAKYPDSGTFDRSDVYIITQNALADETYMNYIRDHYGHERPTPANPATLTGWPAWQQRVLAFAWKYLGRDRTYPRQSIWIPSTADAHLAFNMYVQELQNRPQTAEEDVKIKDGRISVEGVQGVMKINGYLTKMIFDQNKERHAFYVEESYTIPWMDPYLEPYGIILKINKEPLPGPQQDPARWQAIVARDQAYWDALCAELLANPRFRRDDVAQKTFSKLRAAIGSVYAYRGLRAAAEQAFRQGIELCPESPEANYRLMQLHLQHGDAEQALAVLERYRLTDLYNTRIQGAIDALRSMQQGQQVERQLEQQLATDPTNLTIALQLINVYAARQRFDAMENLIQTVMVHPQLPAMELLRLVDLEARYNRLDAVANLLTVCVQRFPQEPAGWYNLARLHAMRQQCQTALDTLTRALSLGPVSEPYRVTARDDEAFAPCRADSRFSALVNAAATPPAAR